MDGRGDLEEEEEGGEGGSGEKANSTTKAALLRSVGCSVVVAVALFEVGIISSASGMGRMAA